MSPPRTLSGVVISAGRMNKAVKVQTAHQVYNSFLRKHFLTHKTHLVSDPTDALRTGDTIRFVSGWRTSQKIAHVVVEILAPWGPAIDERPAVLSQAERVRLREEKKLKKGERRRAIREGRGSGNEEMEVEGDAAVVS